MESEGMIYFKCTSCSECFMDEEDFFAHSRTWHCKILVSEGQDADHLPEYTIKKESDVAVAESNVIDTSIDSCMTFSPRRIHPVKDMPTPSIRSGADLISSYADDMEHFTGDTNSEEVSATRFNDQQLLPATSHPETVTSPAESYLLTRKELFSKIFSLKTPKAKHSRASVASKSQGHFLPKSREKLTIGYGRAQESAASDVSLNRVTISGYPCRFCEKICKTTTDIRRHERVHTGERPYECDICHKYFKRSEHLRRHRKLHIKAASSLAS